MIPPTHELLMSRYFTKKLNHKILMDEPFIDTVELLTRKTEIPKNFWMSFPGKLFHDLTIRVNCEIIN